MHYIYKITNQVNNKVYIGQTVNIKKRWNQHTTAVRKNKPTQIVHHAMIKHGIDNFKFEIIASCLDLDAANDAETIIVSQENSLVPNGYNASNGGCNAPKTDEWKQMMSEKLIGREITWKEKLRQANLGKKQSDELITKRVEGVRKYREEHGGPMKGKHHSEESKQKTSQKLKGIKRGPMSEEHKRKVSESKKLANQKNRENKS